MRPNSNCSWHERTPKTGLDTAKVMARLLKYAAS
jgi:hypothetical protein